jgi:uncharacterized protein (TIGR03000 family)
LQPLNLKQQAPPNPYPAINPDAKKKVDEEVAPPKEKKKTASNDESRGKIRVTIPAGGKLFVDGNPIDVTPGTYVFRTPALAAGRSYFYDVRLEVTRDGGMVADERRVIIRPGEETTAVFANIPPPTATTASVNR